MFEHGFPGVTAVVHRSLLEPILALGVPYMAAVANLFHMIIIVTSTGLMRYAVIGLLVHVGLKLLVAGDIDRIAIVVRYVSYLDVYPPRP